MQNNIQQAASDLPVPALVAGIGMATNPQYFDFFQLTFSSQVGVIAALVGTGWGIINIGKFGYQAYLSIKGYLKPKKNPAYK